jgi:integrase
MVQHLQLRGKTWQFYMRVPQHLVPHYGKQFIRKSLGTSDIKEATRKAEEQARNYRAEFAVLTEGKKATPAEVIVAARALAAQYDLGHFIDCVIGPLREQYAEGDQDLYDSASPSEYLAPHVLEAWKIVSNPKSVRLSDALHLYLKTHQRGSEETYATKTTRDWNLLVGVVGDIEFEKLSRAHARDLVDHLLQKGNKTTTVRRTLNTLGAVTSATIRELEIQRTNPFESLTIQGEGKDAKKKTVPTTDQLTEIAKTFVNEASSAAALMILMQMELGTRIGEISGLSVDDLYLHGDIPHVHFREHPWRSLKNDEGDRKVPLVGVALEAAKAAIALPRIGKGLFEQYAKPRGNDSASAAANKRLVKWGLTSHCFRHAMKDRLREAGCPKDVRDAIQGHASGDIAETYGQGHTLRTMQEWLRKIAVSV